MDKTKADHLKRHLRNLARKDNIDLELPANRYELTFVAEEGKELGVLSEEAGKVMVMIAEQSRRRTRKRNGDEGFRDGSLERWMNLSERFQAPPWSPVDFWGVLRYPAIMRLLAGLKLKRVASLVGGGGILIFFVARWSVQQRLAAESLALAEAVKRVEVAYWDCRSRWRETLPERFIYSDQECLAAERRDYERNLQGRVMRIRREFEKRGFKEEVTCGEGATRLKLEDCDYGWVASRLRVLSQQLNP